MKYFKYFDVETNRIIYYELDEEYYCLRAVFEEKNKLITTNFINDEYLLPEGSFYEMQEYLGKKIVENKFNNKWETALKPFIEQWNNIKNKNKYGYNH